MPNDDMRGRSAIVTGAGRGIGKAVAIDLARAGAKVHAVSQSANAHRTAEEIQALGGEAVAHTGSIAEEAFCRRVVEATNGPDILVNCAGVLGGTGKFASQNMTDFLEVLKVNLMGACYLMQAALPLMESQGFGRIVNFAGGGAAYAYPRFSPYATSKVAIVRLTETIAEEIEADNVTVNVIAPGAVETDMLAEVRRSGGEVRTTVGIEEPVRLVHYLCTDAARHINGRFIHARDDYTDVSLFSSTDLLKLRRTERR